MGILFCWTYEQIIENDDVVLSYTLYCHEFSFTELAGLNRHLFTANWSRKQVDIFDFDDSHVVYSLKSSFAVHCLKTGSNLLERIGLNYSIIEVRGLNHGLLLTNNKNGFIWLVLKVLKSLWYHSVLHIK